MENNVFFAVMLTVIAGLSTGIGAIIVYFTKCMNNRFLSYALGFSAGIMLYVSFMEMLTTSESYLTLQFSSTFGGLLSGLAFFSGMGLIMLIDKLIPSPESSLINVNLKKHERNLYRTGTMTALAIAIHNFPEGLATFTAALDNTSLGIAIAFAIAVHNIPEGIATAIPIYFATNNRKKAFLCSFFSGLTEPLGAIIGYLFLRPFLNDILYGIIFAFIAGIMVYIAIEELIPSSRAYNKGISMIFGVISGMIVMSVSLLMFS